MDNKPEQADVPWATSRDAREQLWKAAYRWMDTGEPAKPFDIRQDPTDGRQKLVTPKGLIDCLRFLNEGSNGVLQFDTFILNGWTNDELVRTKLVEEMERELRVIENERPHPKAIEAVPSPLAEPIEPVPTYSNLADGLQEAFHGDNLAARVERYRTMQEGSLQPWRPDVLAFAKASATEKRRQEQQFFGAFRRDGRVVPKE